MAAASTLFGLAGCIYPSSHQATVGAVTEERTGWSSPLGHGQLNERRTLYVGDEPVPGGRLWYCDARDDGGAELELLAHVDRRSRPILGLVRTETIERAVDPREGRWLEPRWQALPSSAERDPDYATLRLKCCGTRTLVEVRSDRSLSRIVRAGDAAVRDVVSFEGAGVDPDAPSASSFDVHCAGDGDLVVTGFQSNDPLDRDLPLACNPRVLRAWLWRRTWSRPVDLGARPLLPGRERPVDAIAARFVDDTIVVTLRTVDVTWPPSGRAEVSFSRPPARGAAAATP